MYRVWSFFILCLLSADSYAKYSPTKGSYGAFAVDMLGPVDAVIYLLQVSCMLCGVGMIVGGFFKFGAWRRNSVQTTLGVPVVMVLTGLGLIILGYIHYVKFI